MRSHSPESSVDTPRLYPSPGTHGLDEGAGRSVPPPSPACKDGPAPASRPTALDSAQRRALIAAHPHFLHRLFLVLMLVCFLPAPLAHAETRFIPLLRESGTGWLSGHSAICESVRPAMLDYSRHWDMETLEQELVAKERLLLGNRANHGIYHEIHVPVLEEMAELALQMNNLKKAHEYRESILLLKKRLHQEDSISLAKAYSQWADWHLDRYLENLGRPSVVLGTGSHSLLLGLHFSVSNEYYTKALDLLPREPVPHCERNMLVGRLKALHFSALRLGTPPGHDFHLPGDTAHLHGLRGAAPYGASAASIRDLLTPATAQAATGDPALAETAALQLVELADWHALFNNREEARTRYEQAWRTLQVAGLPQGEIEALLSFGLPVPEPDKLLQPTSTATTGYIDVDLELNAQGLPTAITVVDEEQHDAKVVRSLLREIKESRFRPVVRGGAASDRTPVALRYIY